MIFIKKVFMFMGIPYEEGGRSVKFDLDAFVRHFKLHSSTAYYAIRYIEQAGYWTLSEELEIASKVRFDVSRDELYKVQLGSKEMDTFVKVLLRMYSGIFSGYVTIDEEDSKSRALCRGGCEGKTHHSFQQTYNDLCAKIPFTDSYLL